MILVVDASVAIKLVVAEEYRSEARLLVQRPNYELVAPDFLLVEAANILWKKGRKGEIGSLQIHSALADLTDLFDRFIPAPTLINAALALATELDHPIYDCLYLACAQQLDARVVTADQRFLSAGARFGLSSAFLRFPEEMAL